MSINRCLMARNLSWPERLTLLVYSCLVWLAQPLLRRKLSRRAKQESEYGLLVEERFGHYQDRPGAGAIWVHAVSLGEARAAALLIAQLRVMRPGMSLLLTHSTATGWAAGKSVLQSGDRQVWLPWDTRGATMRFLKHFRPLMGVLIETEVWPNLVQSCVQLNVPVLLVNARLNAASFESARRLRWLSGPAYANLTKVLAQSDADARRFEQLGAKVDGVLGNIKFDAQPAADQLTLGRKWRKLQGCRPVLALVSSRDGEEAALITALLARKSGKGPMEFESDCPQILVVPRHPQRIGDVASLFLAAGFSVSRRTEWKEQPSNADIWLGDTMGELALYYAMCDVALLGGSFERFGGQNLIEAAACGCPLIMGPHTYNFAQAADWAEQAGAARRTSDVQAGLDAALDWIQQPEVLKRAQSACLSFANAHQGASQKTAAAILDVLPEGQGD